MSPSGDVRADQHVINWSSALRVATRGRALARTIAAASLVGTTLFCVNQLGQVLAGSWSWLLVLRIGLTYLVPWLNATFGMTVAVREAGAW